MREALHSCHIVLAFLYVIVLSKNSLCETPCVSHPLKKKREKRKEKAKSKGGEIIEIRLTRVNGVIRNGVSRYVVDNYLITITRKFESCSDNFSAK